MSDASNNVSLICLDAVRKDVFDEYARRLRARADVSFEQCRAASGWSVPSHASMITGRYPHQHGIHIFNRDFSGLTRGDTFLADLPDHRAIGASANVYASEAFGFDGFFDSFSSVSPDRRFPRGMDAEKWGQECDETGMARNLQYVRDSLSHDHPLYSLANGALVELDRFFAGLPVPKPFDDGANIVSREAAKLVRAGPEPFFLFTNYMDVHGPLTPVRGYDRSLYDAPPSWSSGDFDKADIEAGRIEENRHHVENHRGLYAAAVDYLDRKVTALIEEVDAATDRETTYVITADHGENLGYPEEERRFAHRSGLSEGLLHVPMLIVNAPGGEERVETWYVSHVRLGELLVGLARGEVPDLAEEPIGAERIGSNQPVAPEASALADPDRLIRVAYEGGNKYQWDSDGDSVRYRLDPERACWQEVEERGVDVSAYESDLFDVPIEEYRLAAETDVHASDVDATTEARLRDLGYL
ncbi:MAG: sulfatase-like hydrolase/transferase [Salinigranum sp.]